MQRLLSGALLCLLLGAANTGAQTPANTSPALKTSPRVLVSLDGATGVIRAVSPNTLDPWHFGVGFSALNFDRDPGDIDFKDVRVQGAVGLPWRLEAFARFTPLLTTNSVNLDPLGFPPPPFDLVVDTFPTRTFPSEPFMLFSQEAPFKTFFLPGVSIGPPDQGAYSRSSGDVVLGVKRNLLAEERGHRFGLGVRGYIEIPTERPGYKTWARRPFVPNLVDRPELTWRKKAGTSGEKDFGFDVLLSKLIRRAELLANVGYKRVGDPETGFRIHLVNSGASTPQDFVVAPPVEFKLNLHDELRIVADASVPVVAVGPIRWRVVGEFFHLRYVGSGTRVERLVHPLETTLAIEASAGDTTWISVGAGWLQQWNSGGNGRMRVSPFGGNINFSEIVDTPLAGAVKTYLTSLGVSVPENTGGVFVTNNPAFDPWRNIPTEPSRIVSRGHQAFVLFLSVRP